VCTYVWFAEQILVFVLPDVFVLLDAPREGLFHAFWLMHWVATSPNIADVLACVQLSPKRSQSDPFIIAVAGGTASGKTTVCDLIIQRLHDQCVVVISQDSFYKVLSEDEKAQAARGGEIQLVFIWAHCAASVCDNFC
jgi:hypothetical protein